MTKNQIEAQRIKQSSRLNEISGLEGDAFTDSIRNEAAALETEYRDSGIKLTAALAVEDAERRQAEIEATQLGSLLEGDSEARERQALVGKARVGDTLSALLDGSPVDGASAECRSAFGLSGYEIPHVLFEPRPRPAEVRAATLAPTAGGPVAESPVAPFIYARTNAAYLGVDMPTVGPGAHAFPALTTAAPSGMKAAGADADETAAVFTTAAQTPKRATGRFRIRYADLAVFPQMEDALRRDIPASVAVTVDQQIVAGTGSAPSLKSLFSQLTDPTAESTRETYARHQVKAASLIDGRFAFDLPDVRQLVGLQTFADAVSLLGTNTADNARDYLARATAGFRAVGTDWIAAKSSNVQTGLARLGTAPMCAAVALWGGLRLIRDETSSAPAGEVVVTALQLLSDVVLIHSAAFKQTTFKIG